MVGIESWTGPMHRAELGRRPRCRGHLVADRSSPAHAHSPGRSAGDAKALATVPATWSTPACTPLMRPEVQQADVGCCPISGPVRAVVRAGER